MITMVIVIFSVESIKIPFIENFSLRQIVNNFTNSFSTYDPILFGPNLLSRPLYLLISLLFITIISLIVILRSEDRRLWKDSNCEIFMIFLYCNIYVRSYLLIYDIH